MRSHSTKNQLKEKSPEANFIRSNTWWALLLFKVQKIQFQCHLSSVSFSHAATVPLARSSPPLPLVRSCTRVRGAFLASVARWLALAGVFCSVGTSRGGRQEAHHGRTPFRSQTTERSSSSPRGHPQPCLARLRVVPFLGLTVVHRPSALGVA